MKVFHCDHCGEVIFFDNTSCVRCGSTIAFAPGLGRMAAFEAAGTELWRVRGATGGETYRLCDNYVQHNVCNWAQPADDAHRLCRSCQLTQVIPDQHIEANRAEWAKLEAAKRRLLYTLDQLHCPVVSKQDDAEHGLGFRFLVPSATSGSVLTGHADGVITVNALEADDAERERERVQLHETYRTLVGHFRHESGHYYWERLVNGQPRLTDYRRLFGDERADYAAALQRHYAQGPPPGWQDAFVTPYASAHPWEDWAECWAHCLHMIDLLDTAGDCGVSLHPLRSDEPSLERVPDIAHATFDELLDGWFALTYVHNNINRSMGLPDGYPFVLSAPAIAKLRFVHETLRALD